MATSLDDYSDARAFSGRGKSIAETGGRRTAMEVGGGRMDGSALKKI